MRLNDNWRGVRGNVRWFAAAVALAVVGVVGSPASAVELRVGDILVAGFAENDAGDVVPAIVHVDPVTRNRVFLSGAGVGDGPALIGPRGIAPNADRGIYVLDAGAKAILVVDPENGDRQIISGEGVGQGEPFNMPLGVWKRNDDSLLVVDRAAKAVFDVNPVTGKRTVISSPSVGSGPNLIEPNGITTALDGTILVASYGETIAEDEYHGLVYAIDPTTGNRSILADATHGDGLGFIAPIGITRIPDGRILMTDNWAAKVFDIDPATGNRTVFTESLGNATPVPNQFVSPLGIAGARDGSVYFFDVDNELMRVGAAGGWASRFSCICVGFGEGPHILEAYGVGVVQVPEPAGMALAAVGGAVVTAAFARRRMRPRGTA
ncbi:MAG: hypothetical protein DCC68_21605 [Planctomycetota bacterium]|nr:MAG: hypothetical protein DCC68_21605 [Planctomycetota bacterium]